MTPLDIINVLMKVRASDVREILENLQKDQPQVYDAIVELTRIVALKHGIPIDWSTIRP